MSVPGATPTPVPSSLALLRSHLAASGASGRPVPLGPPVASPGRQSRAAVLALFWHDGGHAADGDLSRLSVVAIEKTSHLRRHAGQVAFPGGRIEPGESPVQAALREASEEVGVNPADVTVLGELPPASVQASGFDVHTVVGWWGAPVPLRPVDTGEVAAVHQIRVADLVAPENRASWVMPSGHTGPVFLIDDLFVWGLTGYLLDRLINEAGWARPWDADVHLPIPERFFRDRP